MESRMRLIVARTVREESSGRKTGSRLLSLMIGSPDMAFERDLVHDNCKIKTPKVSALIHSNLDEWCEIFISLRTEMSLKWLYISRCWYKN